MTRKIKLKHQRTVRLREDTYHYLREISTDLSQIFGRPIDVAEALDSVVYTFYGHWVDEIDEDIIIEFKPKKS